MSATRADVRMAIDCHTADMYTNLSDFQEKGIDTLEIEYWECRTGTLQRQHWYMNARSPVCFKPDENIKLPTSIRPGAVVHFAHDTNRYMVKNVGQDGTLHLIGKAKPTHRSEV